MSILRRSRNVQRATSDLLSVVTSLKTMNVARPRLLVVSLAIAVVVSVAGGFVWAQLVSDDDSFPTVANEPGLGLDNEIVPNGSPDRIPAATMSDRDGNDVTTASLLGGQPMVINFWFASCPPCAAELPEFADAHLEFGADVRFIGVNTIDSIPEMERFAGERGVTYELFRDDLAEFTDGIQASNFPITLFVTSDGTVVEQTGVIDLEGLREKIATLQEQEELV